MLSIMKTALYDRYRVAKTHRMPYKLQVIVRKRATIHRGYDGLLSFVKIDCFVLERQFFLIDSNRWLSLIKTALISHDPIYHRPVVTQSIPLGIP